MKTYIMRHGLTMFNKENKVNAQIDEPLIKEGVEQINSMIALIPKSISHIYTSTMRRAVETTEIINSVLNIPFTFRDELKEINMGSLAGKSWEEMENGIMLKNIHHTCNFDYHSYGGESVKDVKTRLIPFLKDIFLQRNNEEILIITHGGIIRMLLFMENNCPVEDTAENGLLKTINIEKILGNYKEM